MVLACYKAIFPKMSLDLQQLDKTSFNYFVINVCFIFYNQSRPLPITDSHFVHRQATLREYYVNNVFGILPTQNT